MYTIQLKDVSLRRDDKLILKNISWSVKQGEHWAVIGLNGSGKTSLLRIISGYTLPSNGDVTVLGKKFGAYDLRELRKSIGWVSSYLQESLYANETVLDTVLSGKFASIGLYDETTRDDENRAMDLLENFGCADFSNRMYYTLSQGEKQKIMLARALMNSPELLILDEPCTGLDIFARESFLSLVESTGNSDNSPTLLYVSHHIEEILPVFENTLLLKEGGVYMSGRKDEILTGGNLTSFFDHPVAVNWQDSRPGIVMNDNGRI